MMSARTPLRVGAAERSASRFLVAAACVVFLGLLLREWTVLVSTIVRPIRGDVTDYVAYAWNLIHHHTFSLTDVDPNAANVLPDAFRGPGYPLYLALAMLAGGTEGGWYAWALQGQVLLGAATVALTILLGRLWLSDGWALAAGLLVAVWPHHVVASGTLLTEVLFGFLIVLALWLSARASVGRSGLTWAAGAGFAYAYALLVNPVILFFPAIAALVLWTGLRRREAILLLAIPVVVAGAWSLRNAQLPEQSRSANRAEMNFVQGSWPTYHKAWKSAQFKDPTGQAIMAAIDQEVQLLSERPEAGLRKIMERFASQPSYYAQWYFLIKPYLLWDWSIRIGVGGIYYHNVKLGPFDRHPLLIWAVSGLRVINPLFFTLSAITVVLVLARFRRTLSTTGPAPLLVVGFVVYVTGIHWVFQAEPRYSIPYRPEQLLLAMHAAACAGQWWRNRRHSVTRNVTC